MPAAISDTSPLLYLHRIGVLNWLADLFGEVWIPNAVALELEQGRQGGYDVPDLSGYRWLRQVEPRCLPSEWFALDLGPGELAAMALALENANHVLLLDDALARQMAQAAGLEVWGTLRVLLEAKSCGLMERIGPLVDQIERAGMWLSTDIRNRILSLAGEAGQTDTDNA